NQINHPKNQPHRILPNHNPQLSQLTQPFNKIKPIQPKLTQAINMLQNKQNNTQLLNPKNKLQNPLNHTHPTH
ncbi:hypothetical protein, partial [Staphylococcus epidermidis]|uniref:hypothetical protein n=1 Tax=Staphylococcus epidermidis TaxID=1282 RepID=UPI0016427775